MVTANNAPLNRQQRHPRALDQLPVCQGQALQPRPRNRRCWYWVLRRKGAFLPHHDNYMLLTESVQDTKSATEFYDAKVKELGANIQNLESIVQGKTNNLRVVEEGTTSSSLSRVAIIQCY